MKDVGKYNTFYALSNLLTFGTPIITLVTCSSFFIHRTETSISAAGMFVLMICAFIFKDKIMKTKKIPSVFIISSIIFILIIMFESIVEPIKTVCFATMISTGIDELSFKRIYKRLELLLPKSAEAYNQFGFIFAKTDKLKEMDKNNG